MLLERPLEPDAKGKTKPLRTPQVEASELGKNIAENFDDEEVSGGVVDLAIQM